MKNITINPITRLEGHGKIEIFLNDEGQVDKAYLQLPEFRGFERFCEGRPVEEMPRITTRICGVCPTAHHMASVKALEMLFDVEPTETAKKLRELMYSAFTFEDHILHFFFLGGPDFIVGPKSPKESRNILGLISKVGVEVGKKVIHIRSKCRKILNYLGGKAIHPESALPGGMSSGLNEELRIQIEETAREAVEFSKFALKSFEDIVLKEKGYVDLIKGDAYLDRTYYMGLVDNNNNINFYEGDIRVVSPEGDEVYRFKAADYLDYIGEHVESWSYAKFPFLKKVGWRGFIDGNDSGVYRVGPLARLNVADGIATPLANAEFNKMFETLGGKPLHNTLAFHWARLIESLYAAERMLELAQDRAIVGENLRNIPAMVKGEGVGVVEAPRGLLIHHYKADNIGVITEANLIVASQNNAAAINMSIEKAARHFVNKDNMDDGDLNMVEIAFRAYDPCHGCVTHSLPGKKAVSISIRNSKGEIIKTLHS